MRVWEHVVISEVINNKTHENVHIVTEVAQSNPYGQHIVTCKSVQSVHSTVFPTIRNALCKSCCRHYVHQSGTRVCTEKIYI